MHFHIPLTDSQEKANESASHTPKTCPFSALNTSRSHKRHFVCDLVHLHYSGSETIQSLHLTGSERNEKTQLSSGITPQQNDLEKGHGHCTKRVTFHKGYHPCKTSKIFTRHNAQKTPKFQGFVMDSPPD